MDKTTKMIYLLSRVGGPNDATVLVCATTRLRSLREAVEFAIHSRTMSYGGPDNTIPNQIRSLRADWKMLDRVALNEQLQGGRMDVALNGEIL